VTGSLFHWETPLVVLSRAKGDRIKHERNDYSDLGWSRTTENGKRTRQVFGDALISKRPPSGCSYDKG
jgi:hypothetical protein